MCVTCGCSNPSSLQPADAAPAESVDSLSLATPEATPLHAHTHTLPDGTVIQHAHLQGNHGHSHLDGLGDRWADAPSSVPSSHGQTLTLERSILAHNNHIAAHNRDRFQAARILALNLVSSPGAGKTTLLTHTLQALQTERPMAVIEGDQATTHDRDRIHATGCPVIQVNTGTGCHLDAAMVQRGLQALAPPPDSIVLIENVGNLVCPALFDLGEAAKVTILSVTEGDDKPIKYPHMFRASQVMILNKIDLLPYVSFNVDRCLGYARQVNPHLQIFLVSATRGDGLAEWYQWLRCQRPAASTAPH